MFYLQGAVCTTNHRRNLKQANKVQKAESELHPNDLAGNLGSWLPIGKRSARFQRQAAERIGGVPAAKVIPRSGREDAN